MNPLILALDVEPGNAKAVIQELKDDIGIFKIGGRLFTALGPQVVEWVHAAGRKVFLDLKFHDIPATVAGSCRNAARLGVWGLTIHASGGFAMMEAAARAVQEESEALKISKPLIFGVTVLTSLSDEEIRETGIPGSVLMQVQRLAGLAKKAGIDGAVCSGNEIETVRGACGQNFLALVPGIRSSADAKGDQKRVMTPARAFALGANYIVVGRPILDAPDRVRAARAILKEVPQS